MSQYSKNKDRKKVHLGIWCQRFLSSEQKANFTLSFFTPHRTHVFPENHLFFNIELTQLILQPSRVIRKLCSTQAGSPVGPQIPSLTTNFNFS